MNTKKTNKIWKIRTSTVSGNIDPVAVTKIMEKTRHKDFKIAGMNKTLLIDRIQSQSRSKILIPIVKNILEKDCSFTIGKVIFRHIHDLLEDYFR